MIKIETSKEVEQCKAKPFPKLMINIDNGRIIFATKENTGFVLRNRIDNVESMLEVGELSSNFDTKHEYKDYVGIITLQNI
jgi:hypothetical protein